MDPNEFQNQVLGEVKALKDAQAKSTETLLKNYENLDASTKKAMEDFTAAKN